jgi:hypothetical protein
VKYEWTRSLWGWMHRLIWRWGWRIWNWNSCLALMIFVFLEAATQFRAMVFPYGAERSHSDTLHSVWLVCTGDQPVPETSIWQHTTLTRESHPCPRRHSNPQFQKVRSRRSTL